VASTHPPLLRAPARVPREPEVSGAHRLRRIALAASLVVLIPVAISYLGALMQTSNAPLGIRTVEWLRDNGAADLVAKVESAYYTLTAPSKGGPTLRSLPHVGVGGAVAGTNAEYEPARIHTILHPALPGEGVWHATRSSLASRPPILETTLRDQPEYPRVLAGVTWIDMHRARLQLYPGRLEPSVELPRGPEEVPEALRGQLLATFNSGFKLSDSHGGFVLHGHTYAPMRNGQGTIVGYENGSVDVVDWNRGPTAPAGVSFARQNLPLIVDNGQATPNIANTAEWGVTVGNAVLVWRSSIGVDAHGNLIYVAGENQSVQSLARAQIRAGAVRAMELDINSFWVSMISYGAPGGSEPHNLLPGMERSDTRYLEPDDRDFFAVYSR
jgi:hypothetical protein